MRLTEREKERERESNAEWGSENVFSLLFWRYELRDHDAGLLLYGLANRASILCFPNPPPHPPPFTSASFVKIIETKEICDLIEY